MSNGSIWWGELKISVFFFLPWKRLKKHIWSQNFFFYFGLIMDFEVIFLCFWRLWINLIIFQGCFLGIIDKNWGSEFFF
jgi:hypothetical protein